MFNFEEFLDRHKESFRVERLFGAKMLIILDVKKLNYISSSILYRKFIENGVNYLAFNTNLDNIYKYQRIIFNYKNNTYHFITFITISGLQNDIKGMRFDKLKEILYEPSN